jgi:two-component system sensor histidine kinase KdpD
MATTVLTIEDLLTAIGYRGEAPMRIYLGCAPGVGKTYRMLQDGNALKAKGIDVVIGYLETHGRADTLAQVHTLPIIPRAVIAYRGVSLDEMDVDAIIARRPQLVLVDELPHTNAAGSKHAKRYQDVEEILAAGIAVFTTCNVQHLESVHDMVEHATGVEVRERVPDAFFNLAREIIVVDVSVEELHDRLRAGKIYSLEKVERSLAGFFTADNIGLLRGLALREVANDLEEKSRARREIESRAPESAERVMVAIAGGPTAKSLVRSGSRMAGRMNARWYVVHVIGRELPTGDERRRMLEDALELARQLGAHVVTLRGHDAAKAIIDFAREEQITQIVIGATRESLWRRMIRGSVVSRIVGLVGEIGLHVLPMAIEEEQVHQVAVVPAVRVGDYLSPDDIIRGMPGLHTVEQAIAVLLDKLVQGSPEAAAHRTEITDAVLTRERAMSTFLEPGIAIPHAAGVDGITDIRAAMALVPGGVQSLDRDQRAYIVLLFVSPEVGRANHLKFLAAIARVFVDNTTVREIANASSATDALEMIRRFESAGR